MLSLSRLIFSEQVSRKWALCFKAIFGGVWALLLAALCVVAALAPLGNSKKCRISAPAKVYYIKICTLRRCKSDSHWSLGSIILDYMVWFWPHQLFSKCWPNVYYEMWGSVHDLGKSVQSSKMVKYVEQHQWWWNPSCIQHKSSKYWHYLRVILCLYICIYKF